MDYNARIEIESRDVDETGLDDLFDVIEPYRGAVGRAVRGGRVQITLTLPADTVRQAVTTALSVVLATGHQVFGLEVLPADEFDRRVDAVEVPPLLSAVEAAGELGVSRQRVLQLVNAGQLDAVKVGDTWVIPAAAVADREGQKALRWSGSLLLTDVLDDGRIIDGDGVKIAEQPLPVYDDQDRVIGVARTVRREQGRWWSAAGLIAGLAPGDYRIDPRVHVVEQVHNGDYMRINRCVVTGLTVLTGDDGEGPSGGQTQITVSEGRGLMDLSTVTEQPGPVEVLTYR